MTKCLTWWIGILLLASLGAVPTAAQGDANDSLKIVFFDVDEGDSILATSGGHAVLIDTGAAPSSVKVWRSIRGEGVENLDAVFLTHPHPDHIGGIFTLLDLIPIAHLYDNHLDIAAAAKTGDLLRWYLNSVRADSRYKPLRRGNTLRFGDISIRVLWPPQPFPSPDINSNSLVLLLEFGAFKALLMGDGNTETESQLSVAEPDLHATLLKIGHHGGRDAGSKGFLEKLRPSLIVISAGSGHPKEYANPDTVKRLRESGARVLRTGELGGIAVLANRTGVFSVYAQPLNMEDPAAANAAELENESLCYPIKIR